MLVELSRIDEFALITLNRPRALNALNADVIAGLAEAFEEVAAGDARALLITGAGERAFCAGADIGEIPVGDWQRAMLFSRRGQSTFARLDDLPMPSVALINGYALGGGLELAMACTFRLALPGARMGQPEIKLGLVPSYGGTQRLPRLVGESRALDICMTGRNVGAEEAERIGLVNRIVEGDIVAAGIAFAREFSGFGLAALKLNALAVRAAATAPSLAEGLAREVELAALCFQTEDAHEGTLAFVEKRPARFKDR